jgi:hypothetical protein
MAIIYYNAGLVTFEELTYSIEWYESLGPDCMHLCLEREDQQLIQCYKAGETTVGETACSTIAQLLALLDNPPPKPVPVEE